MERKTADIVIVDDNPDNLRILSSVLKKGGYQVRPVNSGERALSVIDAKIPDLVLLDVMMPGINGFEVCRRLKASMQTRSLPVVFISALDSLQDKVKGFETGGVDYIPKPFQEEEVLARVGTHVKMARLKKELVLRNDRLEEEQKRNTRLIRELEGALDNVKELNGLLPICAKCKKIRDDSGYWAEIEKYIETHTDALFSHGLCPDCLDSLYGKERWFSKGQEE